LPDEQAPAEITAADITSAPSSIGPNANDFGVTLDAYVSAFSRVTEENSQLKQDLEEALRKAKTAEILDGLIEPYARRAFQFMCGYSGFVGAFLLMHSFGCFPQPVQGSVLEFLVGSTAVTVIGLVGMVLTGIFIGARK
jgi:hypothetical protein